MNLKNEFRIGIIYSAIGKYSNMLIQIILNAILSRILTPSEFGIVTVVNVFLLFFQMLADFGIGPAIIQHKGLEDKEIQQIFSFTILMSGILGIIFMLLGYPISSFYNNDVYRPISILLGFCVIFYTLYLVPQAIIQKRKDFKTVNIAVICSNVVNAFVSIILALLGASYYSLIFGNIARALFLFVFYKLKTNLKFNLNISMQPLKKIYSFSKNQFLFNFLNYFSRNLDSILIGRFFNPTSLAYYNKAYQLSLYPNQVLSSIITPVIQPIMSNYETQQDKIKNVYFKVTSILANLGIPLSVLLFFSANDIIPFIFGNQWHNSILTFQILAISIWIQMIQSSTGAIFQSGNRTDLLLLSGVLTAALNIISIMIGIVLGSIEQVAFMIVLSFTINFFINNYLLMNRMFSSNIYELLKVLKKPIICGLFQVMYFLLLPDLNFNHFINLVIACTGFIIVFIIGIFLTKQQQMAKDLIKK